MYICLICKYYKYQPDASKDGATGDDFPGRDWNCKWALEYVMIWYIPSGKLTVCYRKWPIEIVDLPIKDGDFP